MFIKIALPLAFLLLPFASLSEAEQTIIYQTSYGISDPSKPVIVVEESAFGETRIYKSQAGFGTLVDYTKPIAVIKEDSFGNTGVYENNPDTNTIDFTQPSYRIEKSPY